MKIKRIAYAILMPGMRLYWKIFKPRSYGVKVAIMHPANPEKLLLVRHSYGNTTLWNIPGGGYNPKKETAQKAAAREVLEELGVDVLGLLQIGEYRTQGEGKSDAVAVFQATIHAADEVRYSDEIAEYCWVDSTTLSERTDDVVRVARYAAQQIVQAK